MPKYYKYICTIRIKKDKVEKSVEIAQKRANQARNKADLAEAEADAADQAQAADATQKRQNAQKLKETAEAFRMAATPEVVMQKQEKVISDNKEQIQQLTRVYAKLKNVFREAGMQFDDHPLKSDIT